MHGMVQYPSLQWRGTDRISTGTRMHEQVRRILSASLDKAEVERFLIENHDPLNASALISLFSIRKRRLRL
jgi:hypothetical protein